MKKKYTEQISPKEQFGLHFFYAGLTLPIIQPTIYYKNSIQQWIPFSFKIRTIYRGTIPSLLNYSVLIGTISGLAYKLKLIMYNSGLIDTDWVAPDNFYLKGLSIVLSGTIMCIWISPMELLTIQQQNFGLSLKQTIKKVWQDFGWKNGVFRGFHFTVLRECRATNPQFTLFWASCWLFLAWNPSSSRNMKFAGFGRTWWRLFALSLLWILSISPSILSRPWCRATLVIVIRAKEVREHQTNLEKSPVG